MASFAQPQKLQKNENREIFLHSFGLCVKIRNNFDATFRQFFFPKVWVYDAFSVASVDPVVARNIFPSYCVKEQLSKQNYEKCKKAKRKQNVPSFIQCILKIGMCQRPIQSMLFS